MANKLDLTKEDLYGILGVNEDATDKEIVKAYRKQALKCHPDKNPDNPSAAEEFHRLSQALEVLTDAAAKAAYDRIIKAKKAAQLRQKHFDAKRKKFKDDLDERERAAEQQRYDEQTAARNLQAEVERLRKEGNRILEETQEQLRRDLEEKLAKQSEEIEKNEEDDVTSVKIKAKWKIKKGEDRDAGYTKEELTDIFQKYGEVANLVLSVKKSGIAIIEFLSSKAAEQAVQRETGKPDFPLTLTWLPGKPDKTDTNTGSARLEESYGASSTQFQSNMESFQQFSTQKRTVDNKDYENLVLMKMRQAEERKRLIEQMMKEDEGGS